MTTPEVMPEDFDPPVYVASEVASAMENPGLWIRFSRPRAEAVRNAVAARRVANRSEFWETRVTGSDAYVRFGTVPTE